MKTSKYIPILAAMFSLVLLGGCCKKNSVTPGYDFENVCESDYAEMVRRYGDTNVSFYLACGHLNYAYEEIVEGVIPLDSVYFTDMFTIFQVGDSVFEITHPLNVEYGVITKRYGDWMGCKPIKPVNGMKATEALSIFLNSGCLDNDTNAPVGNNVVLRLPDCIDSAEYCYLFGYDSIYVIMNEKGKFIDCAE